VRYNPGMIRRVAVSVAAVLLCAPFGAAGDEWLPAPADREASAAVAPLLAPQPGGPGWPCGDRAAWERVARDPALKALVRRAETLPPLPDYPADLYREFSTNGNRSRFDAAEQARRGRLRTLVLAECVEDKGRFVAPVQGLVASLCAEPTWVWSAHDPGLQNLTGRTINIDLGSSALAWELALTDWLLGDRLAPETRRVIRDNVSRRVLDPYRAMNAGTRKADSWLAANHNWNAVCLAGVTGAALALVDDRTERARFVVAAQKHIRSYLAGFTPDGYCPEGLGYWNYGFGRFALLTQAIAEATGGRLDLLAAPGAREPALFGERMRVADGVYPTFADCAVGTRPDPLLAWYVAARLGRTAAPPLAASLGSIAEALVGCFAVPEAAAATGAGVASAGAPDPLRSWFPDAAVLIGRPSPSAPPAALAVALQGGSNGDNHNHNDVGSYVVAVGSRAVLLDPGPETYTARTFSSRRYESKLLSSYGHPVPVVAGRLQREGADARARVLRMDTTPLADTLVLDMASAYAVAELRRLERTFVYSRVGSGSLTVTDRVELAAPRSFATALITRGEVRQESDGRLVILDGDQAARVSIDAGGQPWRLSSEVIREEAPVTPTRLAIELASPVTEATVTLTITPYDPTPGSGLLRNGGFELGAWCWDVPADGLAAVVAGRAAAGNRALVIADDDTTRGSSVTSAAVAVRGGTRLRLAGRVYHEMGEGVGIYARFFDADGGPLFPAEDKPLGTLRGPVGEWASFTFAFQAPRGTATMRVWIHSYNASVVTARLDELELAVE
jgi:hypothetical protein